MTIERAPLKATFYAFRKREKGGVLLGASLGYLIVGLILIGGFIALNLGALGAFVAWYGDLLSAVSSGGTPSAALPAGVGMLGLSYVLVLFLSYLLLAAYETACHRWMILGQVEGPLGLSMNADTWRVYSVYWMWFLLYIAFAIVMTILLGVVMFALGSTGEPTMMLAALPVYYLVYYGLLIFFVIRFAPAAATSVARHRFSFFNAWTVTRGRFWAMFGSYFLLGILYLVGLIFVVAVAGVLLAASLGPVIGQLDGVTDPSEAFPVIGAALASPSSLAGMIVGFVGLFTLGLVMMLMSFGINARAVAAAAAEGKIDGVVTESLAETFS